MFRTPAALRVRLGLDVLHFDWRLRLALTGDSVVCAGVKLGSGWIVAELRKKKGRTAGLNHCAAFFALRLSLGVLVTVLTFMALGPVALCAVTLSSVTLSSVSLSPMAAAFGVLGRLQVTNFDMFFVFHNLTLLFWIVTCLCDVSGTEQQFVPANDVSFWDQVI
jgi:hypothetical protein